MGMGIVDCTGFRLAEVLSSFLTPIRSAGAGIRGCVTCPPAVNPPRASSAAQLPRRQWPDRARAASAGTRSLVWWWAPRCRAARCSAAWHGRASAATADEHRQMWRRRRATSTGGMRHATHGASFASGGGR
eukprot:3824111-Prymnesium_polylepis.2